MPTTQPPIASAPARGPDDGVPAARRLDAAELITRCDPLTLAAAADAAAGEAAVAAALVGQPRATQAAAFAITMPHEGYHLFISGAPGTGKRALARQVIGAHAPHDGVARRDWVYLNNFERPHQPIAVDLPAGRGAALRADMRALVEDLRSMIPAMFESEEYVAEVERINADYKERAEAALEGVAHEAQRRGLAMLRTPVGFTFAPQKDGEVITPEAYEALPAEQREALQRAMVEVQEQLVKVLHASLRLRKEQADRVRAASRATTLVAVEHAIGELLTRYADLPRVHRYLEVVRDDVVEHADDFRPSAGSPAFDGASAAPDLGRYEVNLLVDAAGDDGNELIEADLPSHSNLVGRVDHLARFGTLVTDFRLIKPGLLHRANGGYLLIDAVKLLLQPFAWDALKRALLRREIRIESPGELLSLVSTVQLEPEPIPLHIKVVLVGDRRVCALLQALDPEFGRLFRVQADLGDELARAPDTQDRLAAAVAARMRAAALLPPTAPALARLLEHGARLAGDAARLSADVQRLLDVAFEAEHLARAAGRGTVDAADVSAAIAARRERAARIQELTHEAMLRDILLIDTRGERVGQVNGLSVYESGGELFGAPMRITATTRLGDGQVIDVQREARLSGPLQAKGVFILSSYLAARYSRLRLHALAASLVFEQTYGVVEGDSASLAELVALLSSIADVPVHQALAVTGSVNQFGDVQAIGGINEKVEGFFELCAARGLDGTHGVVLPEANVSHLMLRDDVIDAVRDGRFALHAVSHVDAALQVLTGMPAGDPNHAVDGTVNGRIAHRLADWSARRRGEGAVPVVRTERRRATARRAKP